MKPKFFPLGVLTVLVVSCSLVGDDSLEAGVYEGAYAWGFEASEFRPCHRTDERWWVTHGDQQAVSELVEEYRSIADRDYDPVFARLRGKPGKTGASGPNESYDRTFEVEEVVELRKSVPSSCN